MAVINERIEADFYERLTDGYRCRLCPNQCTIPFGSHGRCGCRRADEDMLVAYSYGKVTMFCSDNIEKRRIYHFRPNAKVFSVGSIGCNMHCGYCENYAVTQLETGKKRATYVSPEKLVERCRYEGRDIIAFTYSEPTVWFEYIQKVHDIDPLLAILIDTDGYIEPEPLEQLCRITDVFNVDIKAFDDEFYARYCGSSLQPVLDSAKMIFDEGILLELSYPVIPGLNDSDREIRKFCKWVLQNLSPDVPIHFIRFHPDNNMTMIEMTPQETLLRCRGLAITAGLHHVYVANTLADGADDTICPECGATAISRIGHLVEFDSLDGNTCPECGYRYNMVRWNRPGF